MRSGNLQSAIALVLAAMFIVSCQPMTSTASTGPDGLRTFTWKFAVSSHFLCAAFAAARPVTGVLGGLQGAREPVGITGPAGQHYSVIWPEGFTVDFAPGVELRNETGELIARDGDQIKLGQTNLDEANGSFEDPYVAHGLSVGHGCYPYVTQ